jgi:hypothetical protein
MFICLFYVRFFFNGKCFGKNQLIGPSLFLHACSVNSWASSASRQLFWFAYLPAASVPPAQICAPFQIFARSSVRPPSRHLLPPLSFCSAVQPRPPWCPVRPSAWSVARTSGGIRCLFAGGRSSPSYGGASGLRPDFLISDSFPVGVVPFLEALPWPLFVPLFEHQGKP